VSRAMTEQSTGAAQVAAAVDSMRRQADQAARALTEQARAMKDMSGSANNAAKQIKLITRTNKAHTDGAVRLLTQLRDVRAVVERNARGVQDTRGGTSDLLRHAEALAGVLDPRRRTPDRAATNGRTGSSGRGGGRSRSNGRR